MTETTVDLGCGPNKREGAMGVDHHPYPGVDLVLDLNVTPWPIESDQFSRVVCSHVIEHVADPLALLREIHRIATPGGLVEIDTPHFSSIDSWTDPTHRWHLSTMWHKVFEPGAYLAAQVGAFELVSSRLTFGRSLRCLIPKAIIRLMGTAKWEKHYAFMYPARNVESVLRVVK
jgi:ubiquinone/menaquinone biosynthesis C-methylase UbiE